MQEDSKAFVTQDNLDTEIEKLLNLREDYNFAVDRQGNRISADSEEKTGDAGSGGSLELEKQQSMK